MRWLPGGRTTPRRQRGRCHFATAAGAATPLNKGESCRRGARQSDDDHNDKRRHKWKSGFSAVDATHRRRVETIL